MKSTIRPAPRLDFEITQVRDDCVQASYVFHNDSDQVLNLVDQLYRTDRTGTIRVDPDLAYVFFQGGQLTLARQMVRMPSEMRVEWPEVPGIRKVAPKARVEGRVSVPRPFRTFDPYSLKSQRVSSGKIQRVILSLGYFADADPGHIYKAQIANGETLEFPAYTSLYTRQNIVRSEPVEWRQTAAA